MCLCRIIEVILLFYVYSLINSLPDLIAGKEDSNTV